MVENKEERISKKMVETERRDKEMACNKESELTKKIGPKNGPRVENQAKEAQFGPELRGG